MALKIRLRQQGRKNCLVYRLVLSDSRAPRDGKYVELLGWYNPHEEEAQKNLKIEGERVLHWLRQGAVLSEKAEKLVARGAPEVFKEMRKKEQEKRVKESAKRKSSRKKEAALA
ncbi:MAG: 30S ribosomal protein S16 [Chlamydiales bacterium]|nr:30S ribosomal protein S16 [Chlamydiales bacterium]